jgi:hypothetical protein
MMQLKRLHKSRWQVHIRLCSVASFPIRPPKHGGRPSAQVMRRVVGRKFLAHCGGADNGTIEFRCERLSIFFGPGGRTLTIWRHVRRDRLECRSQFPNENIAIER